MSQISRDLGRSGGGRFLIVCVAMIVAVIVAACEEPLAAPTTAHISGRLTLEGGPVGAGYSVVFMEPQRGDLAYGRTDADGNFVVNSWKNGEMEPGRYKVYVVPRALNESAPDGSNVLEGTSESVQLAPYAYDDRYRHLESTPLKFKVEVGENRFEIDLSRDLSKAPTAEPLNTGDGAPRRD